MKPFHIWHSLALAFLPLLFGERAGVRGWRSVRCSIVCLPLLVLSLSPSVLADDKIRREAEKAREVKLLEADRKGEIEARWIAFNSAEGRLLITNKTQEPLKVLLPPAMLAEHMLPARAAAGPGRAQTLGIGPHAGTGYQQNGFFNDSSDSAFFFVPAGKSARADFPSVCLEFGRPDPSKSMRYELRAVVAFTKPAPIEAFLRAWRKERFSQNVAQAAGWRLADGLTWERLASLKAGNVGAFTAGRPMFTRPELESARKVAEAAAAEGEKAEAK